ncbi:tubulin-specific chaperone E [Ixodes scapularis]
MGEQNNVQIGTRVSCDGHYGVVRYLGPVIDTKGTWIGIEWDDPNRGKHNGCHNGVQYFNTSVYQISATHPAGGTCESRCLESGVSTDPEPCGFARPRMAVRGFPVSGEKGILVVEPSPG